MVNGGLKVAPLGPKSKADTSVFPAGGLGGLLLTAAVRLESGVPLAFLAMVPDGIVKLIFPSDEVAVKVC